MLRDVVGWLEYVIFAMGPLGIITAIVSAIRVGGPLWMKAVIGRARENRATVELELMSSTSHEVCELWNGQGIVRSMGKPEVKEIIYLEPGPDSEDDDTLGLLTFETAKEAANDVESNVAKGTGSQRTIPFEYHSKCSYL
jgi:hypothetical protein